MTILVARSSLQRLSGRVCGPQELRTSTYIEWDASRLPIGDPPPGKSQTRVHSGWGWGGNYVPRLVGPQGGRRTSSPDVPSFAKIVTEVFIAGYLFHNRASSLRTRSRRENPTAFAMHVVACCFAHKCRANIMTTCCVICVCVLSRHRIMLYLKVEEDILKLLSSDLAHMTSLSARDEVEAALIAVRAVKNNGELSAPTSSTSKFFGEAHMGAQFWVVGRTLGAFV